MTQKGGKIMMWLLSWAVLALVILYSPIGSPDLYTNNQYIVYNQGVSFSDGIANAPKSHSFGDQDQMPETGLPTYTPAPKTYTINSTANSSSVTNNQSSSYSVSAPSNIRTSTSGSNGGGGAQGIAMFGTGRSSQNNSIDPNTGVSSLTLSSDLSGLQTTATTKQAANQTTLDGGTDPGGDPTGPPIPVGDGYWVLMILAGIYILKIRSRILSGTRMKKSTNFTN